MLAHRTMLSPQRRISYNVGSHTFTVPSGATQITVTVVGGGGFGGQGSGSPNFYLGGGGGSGGAIRATRSVTAGQTLAVVVGAGGSSFFSGQNSTITHNASSEVVTGFGGGVGGSTVGATGGAGGAGGSTSTTGTGWTTTSAQTGNTGSTGQPTGSGNGADFSLFFGITGQQFPVSTGFGYGIQGMGSNVPSGQAGNGIVVVEWS